MLTIHTWESGLSLHALCSRLPPSAIVSVDAWASWPPRDPRKTLHAHGSRRPGNAHRTWAPGNPSRPSRAWPAGESPQPRRARLPPQSRLAVAARQTPRPVLALRTCGTDVSSWPCATPRPAHAAWARCPCRSCWPSGPCRSRLSCGSWSSSWARDGNAARSHKPDRTGPPSLPARPLHRLKLFEPLYRAAQPVGPRVELILLLPERPHPQTQPLVVATQPPDLAVLKVKAGIVLLL